VAVLQYLIATEMEQLELKTDSSLLQTWMTVFTLIFLYLGVTEAYDETGLMICKPRTFAFNLACRADEEGPNLPQQRMSEPREKNCFYDFILIGSLRRLIFCRSSQSSCVSERKKQARRRRIAKTVIILLTLSTATVMELCRWPFWSEWFPSNYSPHYSVQTSQSGQQAVLLDRLNMAKSFICAYLLLFNHLLPVSHFIILPVVALVGSVGFLVFFCQQKRRRVAKKNSQGNAEMELTVESAKKSLHLKRASSAPSAQSSRVNQVCNENSPERAPVRDSILPLNQNISIQRVEAFEPEQSMFVDIVEMLRRESIDLRVNPVAMRRVIFKLRTTFENTGTR